MSETPLRILHLEDNPLDSELVQEMLRSGGLIVEVVRVDSLKALTKELKETSYSLILSDYTIPGMNPLDALRLVRQTHPELPVVFLSGTIGEERATETLKLGAKRLCPEAADGPPGVHRSTSSGPKRRSSPAAGKLRRRSKPPKWRPRKRTAPRTGFIAVLSHELRTPLTAVLPALNALREMVPDTAKEYVEIAARNVEL